MSVKTDAQAEQSLPAWVEALFETFPNGLPIVNPVWLEPSADSQAFDFGASASFPGIGSTGTVVTFQVPEGYNGIICRIGNQFFGGGFNEGGGGLVWQLLADNVPIANYEDVLITLGATANPSPVSFIRIKENQVITLTVENVSIVGSGQIAAGRLGGWFYPKEQEPEGSS